MTHDIDIRPALPSSLAQALDDDGSAMRWTRKRWASVTAQLAMGEAFEVRVGGELAAIGGFIPDHDIDGAPVTQVWMLAGPALRDRARLRAGLDGMNAVLDVAGERHGRLICLVRADLPKACKLVRLCGFRLPMRGIIARGWLIGRRDPDGVRLQEELAA
ncbi:hypothetical protein [Maricaulis sp.]|uniref:hypothetical protein n=1 Tax=Maricaulis sp. TaxID=1486257 RepID=UPI0032983AD4